MFKSPRPVKDVSEKRPFSRKTDSSRVPSLGSSRLPPATQSQRPPASPIAAVSPLSSDGEGDANHRHHSLSQSQVSWGEDFGQELSATFCPASVYSCLQQALSDTNSGLSAMNKKVREAASSKKEGKPAALPLSTAASWRKAAACQILSQSSDDEDDDEYDDGLDFERDSGRAGTGSFAHSGHGHGLGGGGGGGGGEGGPFVNSTEGDAAGEQQSVVSALSLVSRSSALRPRRQSEANSNRVVAPNVAKLSPSSCVEIMLSSDDESVTVLCSADVLKMKSQFFCKVLVEQEAEVGSKSGLWRGCIEISETVPFEAVQLLEGLHESSKIHVEWSYNWARLR